MLPPKKKILIIDDDISLLNALNDKFSREGFSVRKARNGEEGLKIALEEEPDLILLDIIMPVMDGMTMLQKLRETNWGKDAQVVLLTNMDDTNKVAEAAENRTYDYLVKKDYRLEDLVEKVKEKLHMK